VSILFLLYPEWQGSGRAPAVQQGALTIARELLPESHFLIVDSPDEEQLTREHGVVGLSSLAPRFRETLGRIRTAAPDAITTIGGTCGVEAAPVAYLNERYDGDLAVVWFDAHGDLNTPGSSPSGHFHGMVLRTMLGEGPEEYVREMERPLEPAQIFLAGTRDLDPSEREFIEGSGIFVTPPDDFAVPQRLVDEIRLRGFRQVYLHLDLDALDPADFPDTLIPTAGGPPLRHVRAMMESLTRAFTVVGASIVEYVHGSDASLRVVDELLATAGVKTLTR
jgi:arginase